MIENRLLSAWDGLVASTALIVLVVLALGVMVRAVKLGGLSRHLGTVLGALILLILLPAIIVSLWNAMSFLQHLGGIALGVAAVLFFGIFPCPPNGTRSR